MLIYEAWLSSRIDEREWGQDLIKLSISLKRDKEEVWMSYLDTFLEKWASESWAMQDLTNLLIDLSQDGSYQMKVPTQVIVKKDQLDPKGKPIEVGVYKGGYIDSDRYEVVNMTKKVNQYLFTAQKAMAYIKKKGVSISLGGIGSGGTAPAKYGHRWDNTDMSPSKDVFFTKGQVNDPVSKKKYVDEYSDKYIDSMWDSLRSMLYDEFKNTSWSNPIPIGDYDDGIHLNRLSVYFDRSIPFAKRKAMLSDDLSKIKALPKYYKAKAIDIDSPLKFTTSLGEYKFNQADYSVDYIKMLYDAIESAKLQKWY